MATPASGSCACGAVRYAIRPPYLGFLQCHCSRCRKATGSAHATNLFLPADQLAWEAGQEHARTFELSTAEYWNHAFCDVCGSSLPWLTRTGRAYVVPAGTLDEDPGVRPTTTVFWDSRAAWHTPHADLETFAEGPTRS